MLLSAVSVLVVAQSIFEFPEGLLNKPVYSICSSTQTTSQISEPIMFQEQFLNYGKAHLTKCSALHLHHKILGIFCHCAILLVVICQTFRCQSCSVVLII